MQTIDVEQLIRVCGGAERWGDPGHDWEKYSTASPGAIDPEADRRRERRRSCCGT